ncbi:DUF1989 domain-containing protein [Vibrio maritimus]
MSKTVTKQSGMLMGTPIASKYLEMTEKRDQLRSVSKGYIERHSGKAFKVSKGQVFRIIQSDGPQIGDVWVFNQHDRTEHFMGHTTFLYEGAYLAQYSQLWSCMPNVRPMATMLVEHSGNPTLQKNFHNHVALGGHCTQAQWEMLSGVKGHNSCHDNGIQAVSEYGMGEQDIIHDNFMVFQPSFIQMDGSGDSMPSQSNPGDYVEFVADMDLLVAVSACPVGDYSVPMTEPEKVNAKGLGYEILEWCEAD